MNFISDYEAHKRDEEWSAAEDRRLQIKAELQMFDRWLDRVTGVPKQHWTEKLEGDYTSGEEQ